MTKDKEQHNQNEGTQKDFLEGSLIPESERDLLDGPHIIGRGDPNLSPDAGKPIV